MPGKDAVVVWWGALRGAIGLALALVVYTEQYRFQFDIEDGGSGYKEKTTAAFVFEKEMVDKLILVSTGDADQKLQVIPGNVNYACRCGD